MISFAINALWQLPLLMGAGWLFLRLVHFHPAAEHRVWIAVLLCGAVLPALAHRQPPAPAVHSTHLVHRITSVSLPPSTLLTNFAPPQARTIPAPQPRRWSIPNLLLSPRAQRTVCLLYAAFVAFGAFRIGRSMIAARRLLRDAQTFVLSPAYTALWIEVASAMKLPPSCGSLHLSPMICSPAVIGVRRPAVLLPPAFHLCSLEEQRAALCHELAHIKRRDCLVHAVCQVLALPLIWHPAVRLLERHIARTREMACDAMAAQAIRSGEAYAHSLLGLAQTMMRAGSTTFAAAPALGLFRSNKLEERIMRLTEQHVTVPRPLAWMRRALGAVSLASALALASMVHVNAVSAQAAPAVPEVAPTPAPSAVSPDPQTAPAAPRPGKHRRAVVSPGSNAHVIVRDGEHVHRWTSADGQPYLLLNDHAGDLTAQEKRQAENEYADELRLADKDLADGDFHFTSPEFKSQIDQLSHDFSWQKLFDGKPLVDQKQLERQLAVLNSREWQAKTQKQVDEAMAQLNSKEWQAKTQKQLDEAMAQLNSPALKSNLNDALVQARIVAAPEMEKRMAEMQKRMDETSKRLEEATRALDQAQRQLEQQKKK